MEAFLISLSTVALAEIGDRTQLLTLVLVAQYRRPWQIIAGIFFATLANHFAAGLIGVYRYYRLPPVLDAYGASLPSAAWTLMPDKFDQETRLPGRAAFIASLIAFFVAEIGDKTQIATIALAAGYSNLGAVVAGTTLGMLVANVPIVFAGNVFAGKIANAQDPRLASGLFFCSRHGFIARATCGSR